MKSTLLYIFCSLLLLLNLQAFGQISPGELSQPHAQLEGVKNCTQCHSVGKQVTTAKCLACHKEIQANMTAKKGYHASAEVRAKACASCHNDHHGRNFKMIKFDKHTFNHALSGFLLKGKHAKIECNACHKAAFIKDPNLKKNLNTYLGLQQNCLSCHDDYHQGKMSKNCAECHHYDNWKNAKAFDHSKTKFPLLGKHKNLKCEECHTIEIVNGKPAQKFTGLVFNNCTGCHKDVHDNRFGQNCKQCHTEESFHTIKGMSTFNHDKTAFKLIGKHKTVSCKACHKKSLTAPIKHERCTDCHADYHKGQFAVDRKSPDCNQCHNEYGYLPSQYSIEQHNQTKFKLEGGHLATSCAQCHKKDAKKDWAFRNIGSQCVDCHTNVHKGLMTEKYILKEECTQCHTVVSWSSVNFDHSQTNFKLEGAHAAISCAACHYPKNDKGLKVQKFKGMESACETCHKDVHAGQFAVNGKTDCSKCHGVDKFENSKFDHNNARFILDGQHINVKCMECHKEIVTEKGKFVEYKFNDITCTKCHG